MLELSIFFPSEEEVWKQPSRRLRPGLEERAMGAYRRAAQNEPYHPKAAEARAAWMKGLRDGTSFFKLWPYVSELLDGMLSSDPRYVASIDSRMPHANVFAEAMDLCGISVPEVSAWILRTPPQVDVILARGHVIDPCTDVAQVSGDLRGWLHVEVRRALVLKKREGLLLRPR